MSDGIKFDTEAAYNLNAYFIMMGDKSVELKHLKKDAKEDAKILDLFKEQMQAAIDEQTEYVLEIENMQIELEDLQENYNKQVEASQERYLELYDKAMSGNITEKEKQELNNLETERNGLTAEYKTEFQNLNGSISTAKGNYNSAGNQTADLNSAISNANETIGGLTEWNENYNSETSGKICKIYNDTNEIVINDLSEKVTTLEEQSSQYSKYSNFLKN